jgi:hypothetical protein
MGVELEFDSSVTTNAAARANYRAYLSVGATEGYQKEALTAWNMGASGLLDCQNRPDPDARAMYDETCAFISGLQPTLP